MGVSNDFKQQLKAGKIVEALTLALSEAIELEITTWVSSAESENSTPLNPDQPQPGHRMRTRINIVDGDIENEMGSLFIGSGPYAELQQFHLEQVQESRQIIQQNLDNLQQLFNVLTTTLSELPSASRLRSNSQPAFPASNPEL